MPNSHTPKPSEVQQSATEQEKTSQPTAPSLPKFSTRSGVTQHFSEDQDPDQERLRSCITLARKSKWNKHGLFNATNLYKQLPDLPGIKKSPDRINNFMKQSGARRRLEQEEIEVLSQYLFDKGPIREGAIHEASEKNPLNSLDKALRKFLNISDSTQNEIAAALPGNYWVYRQSLYSPGRYIKGWLRIHEAAENGYIRLSEVHRSQSKNGSPELTERYDGIIFKKSRYLMQIKSLRIANPKIKLTENHDKQDNTNAINPYDRGAPRFTIIHTTVTHQDGLIGSMTGMVLGPYGQSQIMTAPVCFERVAQEMQKDEAGIFNAIDIIDFEDIKDESVKSRLKIKIDGGLVLY